MRNLGMKHANAFFMAQTGSLSYKQDLTDFVDGSRKDAYLPLNTKG